MIRTHNEFLEPAMRTRRFVPCLVLVTAAVALLLVGGVSAGGLATLAVVLACPVMMVFMMRTMTSHGGGHNDHADTEAKQSS